MIYIEFLSTILIENSVAIYSGGVNYAKRTFSFLNEESKKSCNQKIGAIFPRGFDFSKNSELLKDENVKVFLVDKISDVIFDEDDILFFPVVNGSTLKVIYDIRKCKPKLKIYAMLHDRQHNINKFDCLDCVYENGIKKIAIFNYFYYLIKHVIFNFYYSRWISSIDKVFTVSNFSLQRLNNKNVKYINFFYQNVQFRKLKENEYSCGDFILFVSGNRPEKNLMRVLIAFQKYKRNNPSNNVILKITGIEKDKLISLIKKMKLDSETVGSDIFALGYVSDEELNKLYYECKYLLFASKAEGFGLPVLEALLRGKASVVSRVTSIPEVVGACALYIDPFDIDSIYRGISLMERDNVRKYYESMVKIKKKIILEQIDLDNMLFWNEFVGKNI
ncbi:Glycosyl transferases group 1 [Lachnospiraceae bacterium KH1T2]|nr:Glycosyl transferases group 1 [Lachnospiraceae bacterium KH1T2]